MGREHPEWKFALWPLEPPPLLPVTNELAAGRAFVHLVFAMSNTKASSEL